MKARNFAIVLAATGLVSSQAFAADANSHAAASMKAGDVVAEESAGNAAGDGIALNQVFDKTGSAKVAELSVNEMKETRGASIQFVNDPYLSRIHPEEWVNSWRFPGGAIVDPSVIISALSK